MPLRNSTEVKIAVDIISILCVGFPILIFFLVGKPFERGFFCDDDSIRYPYKDSTVTNVALYLIGVFLPASVITLVELGRYFGYFGGLKKKDLKVFKFTVHPLIWTLYKSIGYFVFGACVSQLLTDIGKYTIGRLRPHFLSICKPNVNLSLCNGHEYITEYECEGENRFRVKESRLSFPSGHSSFSAYTMVYLAIYLQARLKWNCAKILRPTLQFVCLVLAWFTALSRVSDYKHHWSDVLAGSFLGSTVAIVVALFVSDLFTVKTNTATNDIPLDSDFVPIPTFQSSPSPLRHPKSTYMSL